MDLNKLRDRAYQAGKAKGFYDQEHSYLYHAMEIIAEIGEASNADRKGQYANKKKFVDIIDSPLIGEDTDMDILHHTTFTRTIKDTYEDEIADSIIIALSVAGKYNTDLTDAEDMLKGYFPAGLADVSRMERLCISCGTLLDVNQDKQKDIDEAINFFLTGQIGCAIYDGIDIEWHIEQKMRYNEMRPYLNGKKY